MYLPEEVGCLVGLSDLAYLNLGRNQLQGNSFVFATPNICSMTIEACILYVQLITWINSVTICCLNYMYCFYSAITTELGRLFSLHTLDLTANNLFELTGALGSLSKYQAFFEIQNGQS